MPARLITGMLVAVVSITISPTTASSTPRCFRDPDTGQRICLTEAAIPGSSAGSNSPSPASPPSAAAPAPSRPSGAVNPCTYTSLASDAAFVVSTRTDASGVLSVLHRKDCPDGTSFVWIEMATNDPTGPTAATPDLLLPDLYASVRRVIPRPVARIAPSDWDANGYAFVQMPTFFWVDQGPGQWATVSGTASLPGLSVTVQAVPEELVVSTGDGAEVHCQGAPAPFPRGTDPLAFDGCQHVYRDSSAMAANGHTFPVQLSIVWHASWTASNGQSGDLGTLTTTSDVRQLPVAEIQAILTD